MNKLRRAASPGGHLEKRNACDRLVVAGASKISMLKRIRLETPAAGDQLENEEDQGDHQNDVDQ